MPTLVCEIRDTKLAVLGGRGQEATRVVTTTSNQVKIQDHYPVVSEPGGEYVTHVTPTEGTGHCLSQELAAVIRERKIKVKIICQMGVL